MFDIAWSELAIIGAVALIVIGPKELPTAMRTAGKWVRKARLLAGEFHRNFDDMVRQAELDELKQQIQKAGSTDIKREVEKAVDPTGEIESAFRIDQPAGPQANGPQPVPSIMPASPAQPQQAEIKVSQPSTEPPASGPSEEKQIPKP